MPIEKIWTFHVTIIIKSVVNKNKNYYYYIFLEKGFYKDKFDTQYFQMNVCILYMFISRKLTFLKKLILIKQVNQKIVTLLLFLKS